MPPAVFAKAVIVFKIGLRDERSRLNSRVLPSGRDKISFIFFMVHFQCFRCMYAQSLFSIARYCQMLPDIARYCQIFLVEFSIRLKRSYDPEMIA